MYFWEGNNPLKANVYVDGNYVGNGTHIAMKVKKGSHKIEAKKNGYEDFEKNIYSPKVSYISISMIKKFKRNALWITGGYYPSFISKPFGSDISLHFGVGYRFFLDKNIFMEFSRGADIWHYDTSTIKDFGTSIGIGYGDNNRGISIGLSYWNVNWWYGSGTKVYFHAYITMKFGNFRIGPDFVMTLPYDGDGTFYMGYIGFTYEF
ncbi:PEGA domain-containing protein [Mesoaciditoga sp.]